MASKPRRQLPAQRSATPFCREGPRGLAGFPGPPQPKPHRRQTLRATRSWQESSRKSPNPSLRQVNMRVYDVLARHTTDSQRNDCLGLSRQPVLQHLFIGRPQAGWRRDWVTIGPQDSFWSAFYRLSCFNCGRHASADDHDLFGGLQGAFSQRICESHSATADALPHTLTWVRHRRSLH